MSYSQRYIPQQQVVKTAPRTSMVAGGPPRAIRQNQPKVSRHHIEPELLTAAPRRFRWTAASLKFWFGIAGFFALVATAWAFLWPYLERDLFSLVLVAVITGTPLLALYVSARRMLRMTALLQRGIAVPAVVTREVKLSGKRNQPVEEDLLSITYTFTTKGGTVIKSTEEMMRYRAWQLELTIGAEFTVLYDRKSPGNYRPYFLFTEAEIPGAMGPKVTAP